MATYSGPVKKGTSETLFRNFGVTGGVDDTSVSSPARTGGGNVGGSQPQVSDSATMSILAPAQSSTLSNFTPASKSSSNLPSPNSSQIEQDINQSRGKGVFYPGTADTQAGFYTENTFYPSLGREDYIPEGYDTLAGFSPVQGGVGGFEVYQGNNDFSAPRESLMSVPESTPEQFGFLARTRDKVEDVARFAFDKTPLFTFSLPETEFRTGGRMPEEFSDFGAGFVGGFIPTTKSEVLLTGLSFGVGGLIGGGIRGGGAVLRATIPKASPLIEKGVAIGGLGLGGYFAFETGREALAMPSAIEKGRVFGGAGRELIAVGGGTKVGSLLTGRAIGYVRTRGLIELPQSDIIEPGFFEGQTFPQIKKGTSPLDLAQEFRTGFLPREDSGIPRGFSARIQPLGGETELGKARFGELQGTFIAPRISPQFFRAMGESNKFFSLGEFGRLPTAERITFTDILLAPEVSPRQTGLRRGFSKREAQMIADFTEGTGVAVIPFVKTEKEAVLAPLTPLRIFAKRYSVRDPISSELIPIFEREVVPAGKFKGFDLTQDIGGIAPAFSVTSRSGSYGSFLSPSSLALALGFSDSKSPRSSKRSGIKVSNLLSSTSPSFSIPVISSLPNIPSSGSSFSTPDSPLPSIPSIPSFPSIPKRPSPPSTPYPPYSPGFPVSRTLRFPNIFNLGTKEIFDRKVFLRPFRRVPSLLAVSPEFGFSSSKPLPGEITGLIERPVLTGRRKRDEFDLVPPRRKDRQIRRTRRREPFDLSDSLV